MCIQSHKLSELYETSHESCVIGTVTEGGIDCYSTLLAIHCLKLVQFLKSFDFFMMSTVLSFPGKSFKNFIPLLILGLAKLPKGL